MWGDGGELPYWLSFFTFRSPNVVYVLLGCMLLGAGAGVIGSFAFLRKRSLLGDALAHAALPGVCVAFILTGTKNPLIILVGATISCWIGALSIDAIVRYTRVKEDSALGMVLSVFFGVGILLLTWIQQQGQASQAGLDKFLFGQAASLVKQDVWVIGAVAALLIAAVILAYKELKLLCFDPEFAGAVGLPRRFLEIALSTLIVLAVAIGLQAVGVVLMAALLVTPAAAARFWTDRLSRMLLIAACAGAASGAVGAYVSYLSARMPTGPWMVLAVSTVFLFSLLLAPRRGLLPRIWRMQRFRRRTLMENVLRTFFIAEETSGDAAPYTPSDLLRFRRLPRRQLDHALRMLARKQLIVEVRSDRYSLTPEGRRRAARVTRLHRLWEQYLMYKMDIAPDHVHDDAEEIEHILTPELEARLSEALGDPQADPHAARIPAAQEGGRA